MNFKTAGERERLHARWVSVDVCVSGAGRGCLIVFGNSGDGYEWTGY